MRLRELKGLGPASEKQLAEVGIDSPEQLTDLGAIETFQRLLRQAEEAGSNPPSLNFLYALVGALEDRHWIDIAQEEKYQLLMALEGYQELEKQFNVD